MLRLSTIELVLLEIIIIHTFPVNNQRDVVAVVKTRTETDCIVVVAAV